MTYPSGNRYTLVQSWHTLDNGDHFHYIHVYRNGVHTRPHKYFTWATKPDGTFLTWVRPASWNEGEK